MTQPRQESRELRDHTLGFARGARQSWEGTEGLAAAKAGQTQLLGPGRVSELLYKMNQTRVTALGQVWGSLRFFWGKAQISDGAGAFLAR